MSKTTPAPKSGDPCPACGGQLTAATVPTAEQYAAFRDRENPIALPIGADTASPDQRAELGALHRCERCGYATRVPADPADGADHDAAADDRDASKREGRRATERAAK